MTFPLKPIRLFLQLLTADAFIGSARMLVNSFVACRR